MSENDKSTIKEDSEKKTLKECGCDVAVPQIEDPHKEVPKPAEQKPVEGIDSSNLQNYNKLQLEIDALRNELTGLKVIPKPEALIPTESKSGPNLKEHAATLFEDIRKYGRHTVTLEYDTLRGYGVSPVKTAHGLRESFSNNYVSELSPTRLTETAGSTTFSGTHPGIGIDNTVAIVPGGITFAPTRQYCKYQAVEQGKNIGRFFKTTLPSTGSQTPGTTPSAASRTITAVDITPSTVTGIYDLVDTDKMEDEPYDLLQTVINTSVATVLNFEAVDMLTTVSAEGTLTPGAWINGNTGATTPNSDVSGKFARLGISKAKQYLSNQGYLRNGVRPVAFLHPEQMEQITAEDTSITTYTQYARPDVTAEGFLPSIDGVDLVVTNAVQGVSNTTNSAYNAIICVPQHSYGAASKRDVMVKIHDIGEDNQLRVNVTWRYKTGVIDSSSIVRASSAQ